MAKTLIELFAELKRANPELENEPLLDGIEAAAIDDEDMEDEVEFSEEPLDEEMEFEEEPIEEDFDEEAEIDEDALAADMMDEEEDLEEEVIEAPKKKKRMPF